jgi:hypothetical protein
MVINDETEIPWKEVVMTKFKALSSRNWRKLANHMKLLSAQQVMEPWIFITMLRRAHHWGPAMSQADIQSENARLQAKTRNQALPDKIH